MITKVIVIIFICQKFDFIHPLPDIIRIGKGRMIKEKKKKGNFSPSRVDGKGERIRENLHIVGGGGWMCY